MKLLFTKTVNDANNPGKAFFAGRAYELSEERAKQIMSAVPDATVVLDETVEATQETQSDEPKKKTKKMKKVQKEPTPEEELGFIETPIEG